MSKEWDDGFRQGWLAGHEAARSGMNISDIISKPTKISDPGPVTPNGLSYEEIYGSVIYQQNKKKEK